MCQCRTARGVMISEEGAAGSWPPHGKGSGNGDTCLPTCAEHLRGDEKPDQELALEGDQVATDEGGVKP